MDAAEREARQSTALIRQLHEHEGIVLHAYQDSLGYWSIGAGRLIDKRRGGGITQQEASYLLMNDISRVKRGLDERMRWWRGLDDVRQRVIIDAAYNLGVAGLLRFRNTLAAVKRGDYEAASRGMLASKWATQVGRRARRLAEMMRTGRDVALEDV